MMEFFLDVTSPKDGLEDSYVSSFISIWFPVLKCTGKNPHLFDQVFDVLLH